MSKPENEAKWDSDNLKSERRKPSESTSDSSTIEYRTAFEKDHDRILFSTPVRRLADKTQVFPLDNNDSVRTRLTHSHEVSNLAKSIGQALIQKEVFPKNSSRNIVPILGAIGLAHDLGNPPFGHQGEESIRSWFKKREVLKGHNLKDGEEEDFLKFEGNAQTFRLVTTLQIINDHYGLNLTKETLSALLKYTVSSNNASKENKNAAAKKHGFFKSEEKIAQEVIESVGFTFAKRHPLTLIMEACDDIAYSVMDIEDSVKKGLISFQDIIAELEQSISSENQDSKQKLIFRICQKSKAKDIEHRKATLTPKELNEVSMQMFRVFAVFEMVSAVVNAFEANKEDIFRFNFQNSLIDQSDAELLCKKLKGFALHNSYKHPDVTKLELEGHNVLHELMDMLWAGIVNRDSSSDLIKAKRTDPFSAFAYSCISENYKRIFTDTENKMPIRYKESQLLTDMISGMTDRYALSLHQKLKNLLRPDKFKYFDPNNGQIVTK